MARATNDDGITTDEIDTAFRVLETVRESLSGDGMRAEASTINEAHYLVQQYDEGSDWSDDDTRYWTPEEGDVMYDPETTASVCITEVTDTPAKRSYIDVPSGKRSVAHLNPDEPEDAPVVKAVYRDSTDTEYSFPVTRLE